MHDAASRVLERIAEWLHLRRRTVASAIATDRVLKREVSTLGRGIELGMTLAAERFGLSLAEGCPRDKRIFFRQGEYWLVVYNGVPKYVRHSQGMSYITLLLQAPGEEIHAAALRHLVLGDGNEADMGSAGKVADKKTIKEYKAEINEMDEDLAEARANNDAGRVELLTEKLEVLCAEVGRATGLQDKLREASSDQERARKSVTAAIKRALEAIRKEHKPLWLHLRTYLDTGNFLCYRGDSSAPWST